MQGKEIELNTNLNEEEKDVIDSIEKIESEIKDLVTKRDNLKSNNKIAILKHDLEVMDKVYSLLGELKGGTYNSDLQEVYDIQIRIEDRLENLKKEVPEGTFTEESIEA